MGTVEPGPCKPSHEYSSCSPALLPCVCQHGSSSSPCSCQPWSPSCTCCVWSSSSSSWIQCCRTCQAWSCVHWVQPCSLSSTLCLCQASHQDWITSIRTWILGILLIITVMDQTLEHCQYLH